MLSSLLENDGINPDRQSFELSNALPAISRENASVRGMF